MTAINGKDLFIGQKLFVTTNGNYFQVEITDKEEITKYNPPFFKYQTKILVDETDVNYSVYKIFWEDFYKKIFSSDHLIGSSIFTVETDAVNKLIELEMNAFEKAIANLNSHVKTIEKLAKKSDKSERQILDQVAELLFKFSNNPD